jgi:hypothetical protein
MHDERIDHAEPENFEKIETPEYLAILEKREYDRKYRQRPEVKDRLKQREKDRWQQTKADPEAMERERARSKEREKIRWQQTKADPEAMERERARSKEREKIRWQQTKVMRASLAFEGVDGEGVNEPERAWIEDDKGRVVCQGAGCVLHVLKANETMHMPQKIVCLAVGNDAGQVTLTEPVGEGVPGKYVRGLTSIEQMKWLCGVGASKPKGTPFVIFGGSYDASHILKDLPFPMGWEIGRQMAFDNRELLAVKNEVGGKKMTKAETSEIGKTLERLNARASGPGEFITYKDKQYRASKLPELVRQGVLPPGLLARRTRCMASGSVVDGRS